MPLTVRIRIEGRDYNIVIRKAVFDEDLCFEARIAECPGLAEYADTYCKAYALAIDAIKTTDKIFSGQNKHPPIVSTDNVMLLICKFLREVRTVSGGTVTVAGSDLGLELKVRWDRYGKKYEYGRLIADIELSSSALKTLLDDILNNIKRCLTLAS